jgi:integrase
VTFGKYPALPLADARDKVREVLESAMGGVDPWRTASTAPKTFEALIEEFERRHLPNLKPKTRIQYRNALNHFAKRFKGRDPVTINKREVRAMLDDMVDDGTPIHANRNLAVVRKLFNWAVERSIMDMTPYYGLKAPSKEKQRTRFLSMSEIKSLWSALDSVHPTQAAFVKTLLLTGQRRETVATMRRSNIESGVWTIPREKMKGDRTHSIPLSSQLLELIESLSRQGDEDIVITHDGRSTFSGYSKLKHRLDEAAPTNGATTICAAQPERISLDWVSRDLLSQRYLGTSKVASRRLTSCIPMMEKSEPHFRLGPMRSLRVANQIRLLINFQLAAHTTSPSQAPAASSANTSALSPMISCTRPRASASPGARHTLPRARPRSMPVSVRRSVSES